MEVDSSVFVLSFWSDVVSFESLLVAVFACNVVSCSYFDPVVSVVAAGHTGSVWLSVCYGFVASAGFGVFEIFVKIDWSFFAAFEKFDGGFVSIFR